MGRQSKLIKKRVCDVIRNQHKILALLAYQRCRAKNINRSLSSPALIAAGCDAFGIFVCWIDSILSAILGTLIFYCAISGSIICALKYWSIFHSIITFSRKLDRSTTTTLTARSTCRTTQSLHWTWRHRRHIRRKHGQQTMLKVSLRTLIKLNWLYWLSICCLQLSYWEHQPSTQTGSARATGCNSSLTTSSVNCPKAVRAPRCRVTARIAIAARAKVSWFHPFISTF